MRVAIGRVFAVLMLLAGIAYTLQIDDTPVIPMAAPAGVASPVSPVDYYPRTVPVTGESDYFGTQREIVPFGRSVLEIPILMYHYIRTPPSPFRDLLGYNLSIAPSVFSAQMDWLYNNGYHTVTFNDIRLYWQHVQPLPSKPVVITLDDGYRDLFTTAFPILVAHNFTAVAYIVSGFVGQRAYVTIDMVKQMDNYGFEIAAHTVNHANLARVGEPMLDFQLVQSKRWLENLVGHPVLDMAYPSGQFNATTILAVANAGYYSATTEYPGVVHAQNDRYSWTRVRVGGGEPMSMFISNLGPTMPTVTVTTYVKAPVRLAMLMQA